MIIQDAQIDVKIPEGWEFVRVGVPSVGETFLDPPDIEPILANPHGFLHRVIVRKTAPPPPIDPGYGHRLIDIEKEQGTRRASDEWIGAGGKWDRVSDGSREISPIFHADHTYRRRIEAGDGYQFIDAKEQRPTDDYLSTDGEWKPAVEMFFTDGTLFRRRVEPHDRPFLGPDEFEPHRDRRVKGKFGCPSYRFRLGSYCDDAVEIDGNYNTWADAHQRYTFEDDTPFGVEVTAPQSIE